MTPATFDEVLEAIEHLPAEAQAELVDVVRRRLSERGRQRVIDEVLEGESQFEKGLAKPTSVDDLMKEIDP